MREPLPKTLSQDEWEARLLELKGPRSNVSFQDIVSLAERSSFLRTAFSAPHPFQVNRESTVDYFANEIVVAHGLKPYLYSAHFDGPIDEAKFAEATIGKASDSADVFEALLLGCARILRDGELNGVQLRREYELWLADYLQGRVKKPKRRKGPDIFRHRERDVLTLFFLQDIEKLGYPITESEATNSGTSACHAIVQALQGRLDVPSPKTLMNIWSNRSSR